MRSISPKSSLTAISLLFAAALLLPSSADAQGMQDRPTPGAATRPIAEAPAVDAASPLRQRIADAIAAIKASWRPQEAVQRASARTSRFAWTRRAVR